MTQSRPLTGRSVLIIALSFFGVIITVNLLMASFALRTFPGLEVRNSYIASQGFNARMAEQRALGWEMVAALDGDQLTLRFADVSGAPVPVAELRATVGRPTHDREDLAPAFVRSGSSFSAPVELGPGSWHVRVTAVSVDGREFTQRVPIWVRG